MKTCFKCGESKEISEFYKHSKMADGHLGKCKECTKKDVKGWTAEAQEERKAYERSRLHKPSRVAARTKYAKENPEALARGRAKYKESHPERRAAHVAVGNAVRDGRLIKMPCRVCEDLKVNAHHPDYSKPLEVIWLCEVHHLAAHGKVPLAQFRENVGLGAIAIPVPIGLTTSSLAISQ